jgi:hypothetical protein
MEFSFILLLINDRFDESIIVRIDGNSDCGCWHVTLAFRAVSTMGNTAQQSHSSFATRNILRRHKRPFVSRRDFRYGSFASSELRPLLLRERRQSGHRERSHLCQKATWAREEVQVEIAE